ncbi:MAG: hypothetical protein ACLVJB_00225 [Christensenellales bacterium]
MAEEMAAGLSRVTDAAQLEANNDVIRALAAQIVEAETAVLIFEKEHIPTCCSIPTFSCWHFCR